MFQVGNTILSDRIATARFACDVTRCKGSCCVVGESGAPVTREEIPVLEKAYRQLREELRKESVELVEKEGLIQGDQASGYEIACVNDGECVFVTYDDEGVANCAIQRAWYRGDFPWEKPISCHLYPIRLSRIAGLEYANFEYIPELCGAGCEHGEQTGTWLSGFLKPALERRFGKAWVKEFEKRCNEIRGEGA